MQLVAVGAAPRARWFEGRRRCIARRALLLQMQLVAVGAAPRARWFWGAQALYRAQGAAPTSSACRCGSWTPCAMVWGRKHCIARRALRLQMQLVAVGAAPCARWFGGASAASRAGRCSYKFSVSLWELHPVRDGLGRKRCIARRALLLQVQLVVVGAAPRARWFGGRRRCIARRALRLQMLVAAVAGSLQCRHA